MALNARLLAILVAATAFPSGAALAGVRAVTPDTAAAILALAQSGDTVVLAPGVYAGLRLRERQFEPPLTIDARKAVFMGFVATTVSGLNIQGGEFRLPPPRYDERKRATDFGVAVRMQRVNHIALRGATFSGPGTPAEAAEPKFGEGFGLIVDQSSDVEIADGTFRGLVTGVMMRRIEGFKVARNTFRYMRSDGIQVSESHRGSIEENSCKLTRIRGAEHPDCIQLWSHPSSPPTADIVIRRNSAEGYMQGIGMFNHIRNGVDDGGFDRILIEENDIAISFVHGIAMNAARDSIVRNNRVRTLPDAKYRASINVDGGAQRCGNVVQHGGGKPGVKDKPC